MHPLITDNLDDLVVLCRRHRVVHLDLFGSATTADFDVSPNGDSPISGSNSGDYSAVNSGGGESDIDFLVEFEAMEPADHAQYYFDFLQALSDLFHRDIDLVEDGAIRNPYFRRAVDASRVKLYDAA